MALLNLGIESFHHDERVDLQNPLLCDVHVELNPGEVLAVTGGSGVGKSTLGQIMAGIFPSNGGQMRGFIEFGDQRVDYRPEDRPQTDLSEWSRRAAYLPQDARSYLSAARATVEEEIAFGLEYRGMTRDEQRYEVARVVGTLGLSGILDRDPMELSGGQERLVALACVLVLRPAIVILDEPGAGLDPETTMSVRESIDALAADGMGIVLLAGYDEPFLDRATHRLDLGESPTGFVPRPRACSVSPAEGPETGSPGLELRGVDGYRPGSDVPVVQNLSLSVALGECVAVTGPNGAGKTTMLRAIMGLERSTGRIEARGQPVPNKPAEAARDISIMLQNPTDQLSERTVYAQVLAGAQSHLAADQAVVDCGLGFQCDEHPLELCASQRRLLSLAAVIARQTPVLLLDEPTVSLDAVGRSILERHIRRRVSWGAAVLVVTHDEAFADTVAQRVIRLESAR
ncbi:ATP-binding cassette domain-containing protein [Rothia uropygioeca]|uniref:ATP-binding cassette domain-containing protein n=1 Tax=Kocuria sp. 257 TaxID=2021970 RepID=UPI001013ACD3|nr:ATP-binding cassette domain-containing protein [Kocuria sp. 257]